MFSERYRRMNADISPDPALITRTLAAVQPKPARFARSRRAVLAVALVLILSVTTSAMAASSPDFNKWLYLLLPDVAMYLRPVNISCEDQGIRMEVQAINVQGNSADILVSVQDLTGDRLDSTTDLFDSYFLDTPGNASAGCHRIEYDEETRTNTFYIHYRSERPITQDKITFSFSQLLTGKKQGVITLRDVAWPDGQAEAETMSMGQGYRGAGMNFANSEETVQEAIQRLEAMPILVPQTSRELTPGIDLTGVGYVDGKLHIQFYCHDIFHTDNHAFLCLKDADGREIPSSLSLSCFDEAREGSYEEDIYNVDPETLAGCTLQVDYVTCDTLIKGNWSITFPITDL